MIETNQTTDQPRNFPKEEDGAVTVDWVVLAGAVLLLSIPVVAAVATSVNTSTTGISSKIVDATDD